MMRISRSHYRLLWSAITLITSLNGQAVLPRVLAVSGTIKKLQNAAIVYHRNITARVLAVALDGKGECISPRCCAAVSIEPCVGWRQLTFRQSAGAGGADKAVRRALGEGAGDYK